MAERFAFILFAENAFIYIRFMRTKYSNQFFIRQDRSFGLRVELFALKNDLFICTVRADSLHAVFLYRCNTTL